MRRRSLPLAVWTCLIPLSGQEPDIKVEVERVNLLVTITDNKGRFVTSIPRERFQIVEDGARQMLTNFDNPTDLPVQLALAVDTSGSVATQLPFEKEAARTFILSVLQPQDRALLVNFDRGVSLLHDFTDNPRRIVDEIDRLQAGGGTALLDAIHRVTQEKMFEGVERKVFVVVSDGLDRDSRHHKRDVLRLVQTLGVTIYAIGTNRFGADQRPKGMDLLSELCDKTGGRALFPYGTAGLEEAFDQVDQELRNQYLLTYSSTNTKRDGKFRRIKVKVKDDGGLKIRHRAGYYAAAPEAP